MDLIDRTAFKLPDDFARTLDMPHDFSGDVREISAYLQEKGTFEFPVFPTNLFAAARLEPGNEYTGYNNVWVRDNIHIAHAHYVNGHVDIACRCVNALAFYFYTHRSRFETIITGEADPADPMLRPHIRFNAATLDEIPVTWAHAQNDALGYFVWLFCRLANEGFIAVQSHEWDLLGLFALYFRAIGYWQDEDSGHWEEVRKVEASSIGTVVAGLRELQQLLSSPVRAGVERWSETIANKDLVDMLLQKGHTTLKQILPYECIQCDPDKKRANDSALLYLIYPLRVVDNDMADRILSNVANHLTGEHGIRRYSGDSFWCADYKLLQSQEARTSDFSQDISTRNGLLQKGEEAQWCIFDPLISTIYGERFLKTRDERHLRKQIHHLRRSLSQLTGPGSGFPEYRCPELYYLEDGRYVPNDVTPLLWTQANLMVALEPPAWPYGIT